MGILDQRLASMTRSTSLLYQHFTYNPQNPRHGHSWNSVRGSQIISIGGVDSNSNITGAAPPEMIRSPFDSIPDPFAQGLAIFDVTTLSVANQYTAGATVLVRAAGSVEAILRTITTVSRSGITSLG